MSVKFQTPEEFDEWLKEQEERIDRTDSVTKRVLWSVLVVCFGVVVLFWAVMKEGR